MPIARPDRQQRLAQLAARHTGRPLLLHPDAIPPLMNQLQVGAAHRGRRSLLGLGRLFGRQQPVQVESAYYDDDEDADMQASADLGEALQTAPLWLDEGRITGSGFGYVIADGVAVICASGALPDEGGMYCGAWHGYDTLQRAVSDAQADANVRGIFLHIDSPGGVVSSRLAQLAQTLRDGRVSAGTGGKPTWCWADARCASAAYWIASACDRIHAGPYSMLGSIGAVIVHHSWAKRLANEGIEITEIQFGAAKTDGGWWKALSEGARADLQAEIDQVGEDFVAGVVAGRPNLSADSVRGLEARVFLARHRDSARDALALGLIDQVDPDPATAFQALVAITGGNPAPAAEEPEMALRTRAAAALTAHKTGRISATTALARIQAAMAEDGTVPGEDEDAPAAEDDADDTADPAAEDGMDDVEDDADEEGGMDATARAEQRRISAIMDAPEARGREALARHLAFKTRQTPAQAIAALKAAPVASARRGLGADPAIGAAAPGRSGANGGAAAANDRDAGLVAAAKARAQALTGPRR